MKLENELLSPTDYDKLTDDIYYIGNGILLRLNVILGKKNDDGTRRWFHQDYMYNSKYLYKEKVITMRRNFDYYLTIEKYKDFSQCIQIRLHHMILLKTKLKEVAKWFSDGTFVLRRGKLIIQGKPQSIDIIGFSNGKSLTFDPIVIDYENTGQQQPGVRMVMNNSDIFADMSIDSFYGLFYLIDTFNMYQSAQLLVNYLGRPNIGDNLTEFENEEFMDNTQQELPSVIAKDGRVPEKLKNNKSYFDKIDDM